MFINDASGKLTGKEADAAGTLLSRVVGCIEKVPLSGNRAVTTRVSRIEGCLHLHLGFRSKDRPYIWA